MFLNLQFKTYISITIMAYKTMEFEDINLSSYKLEYIYTKGGSS